MPARLPTFWLKLVLAVGIVAAGDALLFDVDGLGANLGVLLLSATVAFAIVSPAVRRHRLSAIALAATALLALLPFERPSFLGLLLWALAMAVAALGPRAAGGDDGWRWLQRLVIGGLKALVGPALDLRDALKVRARSRPVMLTAVLLAAILPIAGGTLFVALFTNANPVIAQALATLSLPAFEPARLIFWVVLGLVVWAVLRPRGLRRFLKTPGLDRDLDLPGVTTASITVSLAVFNLVFAIQNGLDIAYLWSGAGLPDGVTFAQYAHASAYPLIATALLAGLFVVVFLRPGSATAARPLVRWLVIAWVAQNVFLVASTALRTLDYIDAYSLTRMRIAALLWMGVVALGLILILWRLLSARNSGWLINANLVAAGLVLAVCSVVDLGSVAAAWNVRHAREFGGRGVELDLCYMRQLKGAALVPLADIETRDIPPNLRDRIQYTRRVIQAEMADRQSHWRGWRGRDARRLSWTLLLIYEPPKMPSSVGRDCHGAYTPPPTPPLTPTANPRT
ncbi:DUF4153 domain-containing protein [uncultured Phenylobacterium sp.]|uniref:DUF4153 domain-containing protein n=1 Tax=uncultured Phenylobacterium sp. TaxID=349273 RepID=UPI0025D8A9E2|nr:DUF4173 domain-containing protein [uncultured Phenylobacterium sp.]